MSFSYTLSEAQGDVLKYLFPSDKQSKPPNVFNLKSHKTKRVSKSQITFFKLDQGHEFG